MEPDHFQQAVINARPDRSFLVHACAGSGKSTTLALRAHALIKHGISPSRILLLTFSASSAGDLTAKLLQLLPDGAPTVRTHHAFALSLLRRLPGTHSQATVCAAAEQKKLLKRCVPGTVDKASAHRLVKSVSSARASGRALPEGSDERFLVDRYTEALRSSGQIDFDDMAALAAAAVRASSATGLDGGGYTPDHTHLLLDEAQDTSQAQFALLRLVSAGVAVTVVGDGAQTIYGFRGSKSDILERMGQEWACTRLALPTNYRSSEGIVKAARAVIDAGGARSPSSL